MPDFRLKVFHSVASHLSFTKAEAELFITQPAVTKNIQELEKEYGVRLFEHKSNKNLLTPAGHILMNHTQQILGFYKQIDHEYNIIMVHHHRTDAGIFGGILGRAAQLLSSPTWFIFRALVSILSREPIWP